MECHDAPSGKGIVHAPVRSMHRVPRPPRGGRPQTARAEWKQPLYGVPRELSRGAPVRDRPGHDDEASPGCPEGRERSFLPCLPLAPPVGQRLASREERPGALPRLPSGTVAIACTGTFPVARLASGSHLYVRRNSEGIEAHRICTQKKGRNYQWKPSLPSTKLRISSVG
jgi:hypothetical protein